MSKVQKKSNRRKPKPKAPSLVAQVARAVGGTLGSLVGQKELGQNAGSWLANVTGLGDYALHQNSFMKSSAGVPQFEYNADGSVVVTHREFVQDVIGSTTFASTTLDICPTNIAAFPWLSTISPAYDQYEFLGLLACYVPASGDAIASTNNTLGSVILATEYDVSRPLFSTESEMQQYMFVTSEKPSEPQIHPIECNPKRDVLNARYMDGIFRTTAAAVSSTAQSGLIHDVERNLRCTGRLQISTVGMQAVTTVGKLWWTYKVKFSKPRGLPPGASGGFFHATSALESLVDGETMLTGSSVIDDSTWGANNVGINSAGTGITLTGVRPGTKVNIIYTAKRTTGAGGISLGAVSGTSVTAINEIFANSGVGTSTVIVDATTSASGWGVFMFSCYVTEATYVTPATITWANPSITAANVFTWDLQVYLLPRPVPATAVLTSPNQFLTLQREMRRLEQKLLRTSDMKEEDDSVVIV
jgi:hypothetical protein